MREKRKFLDLVGILTVAFSLSLPLASLSKEKELFVPETQLNCPLMITTTEAFQGYRIKESRGIVRGVTVRQPTVSQGLKASLKGIVGGRMSPFITMCETARQQALDIMIERAQQMGANAIVGVRYDSSAFGDNDDMGTEVVCYGTAVVIEPETGPAPKSAFISRSICKRTGGSLYSPSPCLFALRSARLLYA